MNAMLLFFSAKKTFSYKAVFFPLIRDMQ